MIRTRRFSGNDGFTLIELMIVGAIMSTVLGISMIMLKQANDVAALNIIQAHYEGRLQTALDDISLYIVESDGSRVDLFNYDMEGQTHTAIVFPTARDRDGEFIFRDPPDTGIPSPTPLWQALVVYAYTPNGFVRKYMDFTPRNYTNPPEITEVTATEIKVWDGTATISFNLDGTPQNGNQRVRAILDRARILSATDADDDLVTIEPPVKLSIEADIPIASQANRTIVVTLETSVLMRNKN